MNLKTWMLLLPLSAMALLSSCGGEEEVPKPTASITITGDKISGNEVEVVSDIVITASATAGSESLKSVKFSVKINGAAITVLDTAVISKSFTVVFPTTALGSTGDDVEYIVTAMDANGTEASASTKLSVVPKLLSLDGSANQIVYNSNAQGQNIAYDLVAGFALAKGSAPIDQDIKDATGATEVQWSKKWTSGNGTKFIKITANDWNNSSSTTYLYNLYKANKDKMTTEITFEEKDVILAKSTQDVEFNIYIIQIDKVTDLPAVGNNNDFAQFSVKGINYPK